MSPKTRKDINKKKSGRPSTFQLANEAQVNILSKEKEKDRALKPKMQQEDYDELLEQENLINDQVFADKEQTKKAVLRKNQDLLNKVDELQDDDETTRHPDVANLPFE